MSPSIRVPSPPAPWQLAMVRRWPGHWSFALPCQSLRLLLAPSASPGEPGQLFAVLVAPAERIDGDDVPCIVSFEPHLGIVFGGERCETAADLPATIAVLLVHLARNRAHGYDRALLTDGHAPSGGHPAWLHAAIDHAWTSSGTPEGAAP